MDYDSLVQEILKRVLAKLQEKEESIATTAPQSSEKPCCCQNIAQVIEKTFKKRIITERDLHNALADGAKRINVCENAILTDLAREYAAKNLMEIVRG